MEILDWIVQHADKLGVVATLMIVIAGLVWVLRILYAEKTECEADRLENKVEIGEIKGQIVALKTKVELEEQLRNEHLAAMTSLHHDVLKAVVGTNHA